MPNKKITLTPINKTFSSPDIECSKCGNAKKSHDIPVRNIELHLLRSLASAVLPDYHNKKRDLFQLWDLQDTIENVKDDDVEIDLAEFDIGIIEAGWKKFNGLDANGNPKAPIYWYTHCKPLIRQILNLGE